MSWYLKAMKKYAVFNGRARRKEYWMFRLFNVIFLIVTFTLDFLLGTTDEDFEVGLINSLLEPPYPRGMLRDHRQRFIISYSRLSTG